MPRRLETHASDFAAQFAAIVDERRESEADVVDVVRSILAEVRVRGDSALIEYSAHFDHVDLRSTHTPLHISTAELDAAHKSCDQAALAALHLAADRITAFHQAQLPTDLSLTDATGTRSGTRWRPLDSVGLYVPGGRAAYPSSVLMNALPAKVAGVERLVMVTPTPSGEINPLVLAAARLAGVDELYRLGGAQAVAALAYGTQSIQPVDKIVGPGNAYVAEAKRQVFGRVGIDMIAGPSEIVVVADAENDPRWIAADLLSQAEHDPQAQSILITPDAAFADRVCAAIEAILPTLASETVARASWQDQGVVIIISQMSEAVPLINALAPEHLELALAYPQALLDGIRHVGSIFLGRHTPEAIGDYVGGPNHVLPTSRRARFASGLSVADFMKRTTYLECSSDAFAALGPAAATLADAEGLPAHALSIRVRQG